MEEEEVEKIDNPIMKKAMLAIAASLVVFIAGYICLTKRWGYSEEDLASLKQETKASITETRIETPVAVEKKKEEPFLSDKSQKPESSFIYYVPVSTIVEQRGRQRTLMFAWKGKLMTYQNFPYPKIYNGNTWYAVLDQEIFEILYPDGNELALIQKVEKAPTKGLEVEQR